MWVSKRTFRKKVRDKHLDEIYKILKQPYFKSVRRYDIIHSCIKYEEALPKRRKWVDFVSSVFIEELSISLAVLKRAHLWLLNKGQ